MPLEVLLILVAGGICGIALALHVLGLSRSPALDQGRVHAAWLRHYPANAPRSIRIAADARAALVDTAQGPGLVWCMGADTTARLVVAPRLRRVKDGLRVRLADPGAPQVRLRLDADDIQTWQKALSL